MINYRVELMSTLGWSYHMNNLEKKRWSVLCNFCRVTVLLISQMRLLSRTVLNFDQMYIYHKFTTQLYGKYVKKMTLFVNFKYSLNFLKIVFDIIKCFVLVNSSQYIMFYDQKSKVGVQLLVKEEMKMKLIIKRKNAEKIITWWYLLSRMLT